MDSCRITHTCKEKNQRKLCILGMKRGFVEQNFWIFAYKKCKQLLYTLKVSTVCTIWVLTIYYEFFICVI